MMSKTKKWVTAILTVAMALCCTFGLTGVFAAEKGRETLITASTNTTVTPTAEGMKITSAAAWNNSVDINADIDIDNFEFEIDNSIQDFVDIRFLDAVAPYTPKFFIRLNTTPPGFDYPVIDIFRNDDAHLTRIDTKNLSVGVFENGKCNFSCENGILHLNGVDVSEFTGNKSFKEFLATHAQSPVESLPNDLAWLRLRFNAATTVTVTRLNGTSLAAGAEDTSKPFFRLATVPESSVAAGSNVAVSYTVYDLIDDAPTVSAEYRLSDATEGEWTNTAVTDSKFAAPASAGTYTVRLKGQDAKGNVGYSEEFSLTVTAIDPPEITAEVPAAVNAEDEVTIPEAQVTGADGMEIETTVKVYDVYGDEVTVSENAFTAQKYSASYQIVYESRYKTAPEVSARKSYTITVQGAYEKLTLPELFTPVSADIQHETGSTITAEKEGVLIDLEEEWAGARYEREVNYSDFTLKVKPVENVKFVFIYLMSVKGDYNEQDFVRLNFESGNLELFNDGQPGKTIAMGAADAQGFYTLTIKNYNTFAVNGAELTEDLGIKADGAKYFGFKFNKTNVEQPMKIIIGGVSGQSFARPYECNPTISSVTGVSESVVKGTQSTITFEATDFFGKALTAQLIVTAPDAEPVTLDITGNSISYAFDKTGVYSLTLRVFNAFGGVAVKEFSVTATEPVERGIEIETEPTKTAYKVGENLSLEGLSVKVLYEGGASRVLDANEYEVTGFDSSEAGTVTLTVEYKTFTDTFTVTVENPVLESIEINVKPTKTKYVLGTELDLSGMIVKAKYDTGDSKTITDYTVSGYDKNTLGEQTVTVTYEGKKATFKVTVTNDRTGIEITSNPTKLAYTLGEELDLSGLKLNAVLENGTKVEIPAADYTVTGYDKNAEGEQTITVSAYGFETTFKVTVSAKGGCGTVSSGNGIAGLLLLAGLAAVGVVFLNAKKRNNG